MRPAVKRQVVLEWWTNADSQAIYDMADGGDDLANINNAA